jgi:hypothetical protein
MSKKIPEFLMELTSRGVVIEPHEGRLRIDAPAGLLTGIDRERLIAHKEAILKCLQQEGENDKSVQAGDLIRWVSPVVGPAGPATVLARSGQWLLVNKPSHELAVPIVHEGWDVRRVDRGKSGPHGQGLT